ncbi:MAG: outer membrane protein assembly factor BamE [Alphaproteobacteria bacterium]|nr:outer membrane protein assembly factor BamE [Alphaproteobacteria bacterium]
MIVRPQRWILGLALMAAACGPFVDIRGYVPDADQIQLLRVGQQTKDQVTELLGSPSSQATFEQVDAWYYINRRIERTAFFEDIVTDQKVLAIHFGRDGRIARIEGFGLDDTRKFALVQATTPTHGHDLGMLEQLFGNIGRFNVTEDQKRTQILNPSRN